MRHVFETMGTVASVDVPATHRDQLAVIEGIFRDYDERFSLYRPDSELSQIANGHLTVGDASDELRSSFERALAWRTATAGLFSPERPDGVLDLNGIVKAEAIGAAGRMLDDAGCSTWSINVGGDILVRTGDAPWITGIADPTNEDAILHSVPLAESRRALATSGSAQRGDHIWRGGETMPTEFVQVSVAAADIVTADVLATAIVAGGPEALDDICERFDIDVLAVLRSGAMLATPRFLRAAAN